MLASVAETTSVHFVGRPQRRRRRARSCRRRARSTSGSTSVGVSGGVDAATWPGSGKKGAFTVVRAALRSTSKRMPTRSPGSSTSSRPHTRARTRTGGSRFGRATSRTRRCTATSRCPRWPPASSSHRPPRSRTRARWSSREARLEHEAARRIGGHHPHDLADDKAVLPRFATPPTRATRRRARSPSESGLRPRCRRRRAAPSLGTRSQQPPRRRRPRGPKPPPKTSRWPACAHGAAAPRLPPTDHFDSGILLESKRLSVVMSRATRPVRA